MVFGDSKHMRLLENWITAATMTLKPPLDNVMVLSLDHLLCDKLVSTKFHVACIAAPIESFIVAYPEEVDKKWCAAMMVRQVVLRLINYWGYDVASYDSDAVLLHNPQVLYDARPHVDVFSGSTRDFPGMVSKKWGFNLSCGILMLRATPSVGMCITAACSNANVVRDCNCIYIDCTVSIQAYVTRVPYRMLGFRNNSMCDTTRALWASGSEPLQTYSMCAQHISELVDYL